MPRFFFDLEDEDGIAHDDIGIECADWSQIGSHAADALAEFAGFELRGTPLADLCVRVRNEAGRPVCRTCFQTRSQWLCRSLGGASRSF